MLSLVSTLSLTQDSEGNDEEEQSVVLGSIVVAVEICLDYSSENGAVGGAHGDEMDGISGIDFMERDIAVGTMFDDSSSETSNDGAVVPISIPNLEVDIRPLGELVELIREPQHPFNPSSIRVNNMRNQNVGNLLRDSMVDALASIMDQFPTITVIGTTAPIGGDLLTLVPCSVELYGKNNNDFRNVDKIFREYGVEWVKNNSLHEAPAPVVVTTEAIDWKCNARSLDEMFDQLQNEQLASLPCIPMPSSFVSPRSVFHYQEQGIRWLYHRETCNLQSPFFKEVIENGNRAWFSQITNTNQPTEPTPIRGSILADDMGLGKTLQAIGLILANPPAPGNSSKTTLIVCPVSVMSSWTQQIEEHVEPGSLKTAIYHGNERGKVLANLNNIDVLISSFGTISTEFGIFFPSECNENRFSVKRRKVTSGLSIFQQTFFRVILDEAHIIRNTLSRTFRGCCRLQATHKLCLTGTPLQNKPEDIHSLLRFLHVEPLHELEVFRRFVSKPILQGNDVGLSRLRTVMAHIALRRTKSAINMKMANKVVELRTIEFPGNCPHKQIHDMLFESGQAVVRASLGAGDEKTIKNWMVVLEMLTRVRQACVSADLIPTGRLDAAEQVLSELRKKGELSPEDAEALLRKLSVVFEDVESVECAVCFDEIDERSAIILKRCAHVFCEVCLKKITVKSSGFCPLCRQKFVPHDLIKKKMAVAAVSNETTFCRPNEFGPSPKLNALLQAIGEMKHDEKGVIFSQFTKFLDIIGKFLSSHGYAFVRIDGSYTATQRTAVMKEFAAINGPRFVLCSLHAAANGITLHRANHCFMMDTWWNGSVEDQAMNRVHRIGQSRDVRIIRFVMKDSVEARMIDLQEAKHALSKGAMEKLSPEELRKLRIGQLKSLFSIRFT